MSEVMGKLGSVMNFCHAPNFFFEKQTHTHTRERKKGTQRQTTTLLKSHGNFCKMVFNF